MIICNETETEGRLGNQLWRIASTIGMAMDRHTTPAFPSSWSYRPYFNLPDEWFFDELPEGPESRHLSDLPPIPSSYLQDYRLWSHHEWLIRKFFEPSEMARKILIPIINGFYDPLCVDEGPIMSIHVRRGDNVTNDPGTINCLPIEYYLAGAAATTTEARSSGWQINQVAVFTDDFEWCTKELVPLLDFESVGVYRGVPRPKENGTEYAGAPVEDWIDLQMMALTDFQVISNSTYAWWAAFLSTNRHPTYPSYWYGKVSQDMGFDSTLMFPESWRKIDVKDPNPC